MPFPLIPIIAIGVSSGLAALCIKKSIDVKKTKADEDKNTFGKYAVNHRTREKATESITKLEQLKVDILSGELRRFSYITENILHYELTYEAVFVQSSDISPFISSAPVKKVELLGSSADLFYSGLNQLRKEMVKSNHQLQQTVLEYGFDFRKYRPFEKAVVIRSFYLANTLASAMNVSIIDDLGEMRETAIDEFEDYMIDRYLDAVG
jgi:hypothetical protein